MCEAIKDSVGKILICMTKVFVSAEARVAGEGIVFSGCPSVRPSVCPSVRNVHYQTREQDILKMNEATLMQTGRSGLRGRSMKMSTFGVRRSKVKVTRRENRLKNAFRRNVSITIWRILTKPGSTVTANADCVITTRMQKIKGRRHAMPKLDLEPWRRHHSPPRWVR